MVATAQECVEFARTFVGKVRETPPGSNHTVIGKRYGWDGVAYCAEGVWVVLDHSDVEVYKTASAHLLVNSGNNRLYGSLVTRFQDLLPGDVAGWNFDAAANVIPNIHHVSMVSKKPDDGWVTHVGFNTSPPAGGGTEWNGEGCWEKAYPASYFCSALRPNYGGGKFPGDNGRPRNRFTLERGDKGADVRLWQTLLNIVDKADIAVDGHFGLGTHEATVKWQKAHGRKADGSVTLEAMHTLEQKIAKL
jgi:hypothetical protein